MAATNFYADFSNNTQNMYNYAASSYYDNSYYQQQQANTTWNPATYNPSYMAQYHNSTLDSTSCQMFNDYYNYNSINEQLSNNSSSLNSTLPTSEVTKTSLKRKASELEEPRNKTKDDSKADSEEPPSKLRALLTNPVKKLKYTPDYYYTSMEKVSKTKSQESTSSPQPSTPPCYEQDFLAVHSSATQQTILSPQRSEIDYLDAYSPLSLKQTSHQSAYKNGSSSSTTTTTTTTSNNSEPTTPASLVDGISTPPLSPSDKHVNHHHHVHQQQQHEINHQILTGHDYNWSNCEDSPASGRHF